MSKRKGFFSNPYIELGNILQDYGMNGDRQRARRRLNIQAINYEKVGRKKPATLFRLLRKNMKGK